MRRQLTRIALVMASVTFAGGCGGGSPPSASRSAAAPPVAIDANDTTPEPSGPSAEEEQFIGECWAVQILHYYQPGAAPDELVSSWSGGPCEECRVNDLRAGALLREACNYCEHTVRIDCTIRSMTFPGAWDDLTCRVGDDRMGITAVADGFWLLVDEQRIDASGKAVDLIAHAEANTAFGLFTIGFDLSLTRISETAILGGGMSDQGPLRVHGVPLPVESDEGDVSACPEWGSE